MKLLAPLRTLVAPAALLFVAALPLTLFEKPAHATFIYDWTGTCTFGCTGTASAVLTLAPSYTPGTTVSLADFVSFTFDATGPAVSIAAPPLPVPSGSFVGDLPLGTGFALSSFTATDNLTWAFTSLADGSWQALTPSAGATGTGGTFALRAAAVPEPGTLTLFTFALGALVFLRKRRRWSAMVASAVAWRFRSRSWSPTRRAPNCATA
ncbi:MAG: PEP-CTERM sorting domain-containing protein [Kiloniellales bacterium]|nr:PEP-CTERM sorting domain-containing protein [Kiloniellales bacterium]